MSEASETTETPEPKTSRTARIVLPLPPSVNDCWMHRVLLPKAWGFAVKKITGDGLWAKLKLSRYFVLTTARPTVMTAITTETRQYRQLVAEAVRKTWPHLVRPTTARLKVRCTMYVKTKRRRDVDNVLKVVLDALTHAGVWTDDSQVDELTVCRGPVGLRDVLDVTIEAVNAPQQKTLLR